jgi:hypothetical protein
MVFVETAAVGGVGVVVGGTGGAMTGGKFSGNWI